MTETDMTMPRTFPAMLIATLVLAALLALAPRPVVAAGEDGETVYASTLTTLRAAPDGEALSSIMPGVPMRVVDKKKGWLKVQLTGWSPEGAEKYLFKEMGQRILVAKITPRGMSQRKVVAQKEDYYESVWQDVRLSGWVASKAVAKDILSVWKAASHLYHQRCTRCHALHRPKEFTANQWPSILKIMTVRAGLSAGKKALVMQFIQTHAKDQKNAVEAPDEPQTAAAPQEDPQKPKITGDAKLARKGAKLFQEHACNACHGDDARTPALPAYPRLAGQSADYAFKQMQDFKAGKRANDEFGVMKENMAEVPEADMRAIAWWLSTL